MRACYVPCMTQIDGSRRRATSDMTTPCEQSAGTVPGDAFADALARAQGEYLEMPGLQLTEAQAARLWSFDSALCSAVLSALVERRFLVRTRNASFARGE